MNKDQVKGKAAKDIVGKGQEKASKLIGGREQKAKGRTKQIADLGVGPRKLYI
jgi:uncharacterized protein YjbJ (UPF0337 family)